MDRGVKYSVNKNFDGDYSHLFDNTDLLKQSDIAFGNLEGPVSDKGVDLRNLYSFRMDTGTLDVLKSAGFDILSFANNHVGDWGRAAFDDTMVRLENAGIRFTGAGTHKSAAEQPEIFEIKGMKIGFLGFSDVGPASLEATPESSGILLLADPNLTTIISNAKKQVDALIVSVHWGNEYVEHSARQSEFAHKMVNAGANLVIGHHPHVTQAVETYKGGVIAYSLGNFVFDQAFSKETMQGMLLRVVFDAKDKVIKRYDKFLVKISPQFQPQEPEQIK
jgi:poly-gamma-glutamate capsule biosynthesis protein CapA/YwtB (metallophosphatase superfamily)